LGGLFVVWGAFFAAIVIHELGHFVAGRIVGFRLQSLQFGPILIAFEFGNLRVRIQPRMASAGFTAMHISSFSRLHYKLMCFISAGPASDLLCAVVVIVLMRAGVILDLHVSGAFRLFAGTSLFCFVTSILPLSGKMQLQRRIPVAHASLAHFCHATMVRNHGCRNAPTNWLSASRLELTLAASREF